MTTTTTTETEQTAQPSPSAPAKGIQVTDKALVKVRSAMAKEGINLKDVKWAGE